MSDELERDDAADGAPEATGGGGFVAGVFFGLLAGAALAMIAAPQSGEDTRDLLRAKAREAADRVSDTVGDVSDTVTGGTNDLVERGRAILDNARSRIDTAVAEGKDAADRQRAELEKNA